jgi:hypothetical protein
MWHQVYSYREASGLVRCIYSFVQGRRVLGIWFAPHFGSQDEQFACAVETWIDSLLANGYSLYVASVTEEEWRTAPERAEYHVAELQRLLA